MQIVIDISDRIYKIVQKKRLNIIDGEILEQALANGTPLPEGAEILTKEAYSDLCTRAADVPDTNVGDLISRKAAIDAFHFWFRDGFDEDKWWNSTHVLAAIEGLPSVHSEHKWETCFECPLSHGCPKVKGCTNEQAIEYASQIPNDCPLYAQPEKRTEKRTETHACVCISRQAAEALFRNARKELMEQDRKKHIKDFNTRDLMLLNAEQLIHLLPSVTSGRSDNPERNHPESIKYCEECDHIEMCSWYPTDGCEWLKTDRHNAGYNDAKREIALSGEYKRAYDRGYEQACKDKIDIPYKAGRDSVDCENTKCENCTNHNYCDYETESEDKA